MDYRAANISIMEKAKTYAKEGEYTVDAVEVDKNGEILAWHCHCIKENCNCTGGWWEGDTESANFERTVDCGIQLPVTPYVDAALPAPDAVTHYIENHLAGEIASIMDEKAQELTLKISDNGKPERSISWKSELKSEDAPGLMTTTTIPATPGNTSMQKCTESYRNSHWLIYAPNGEVLGLIGSIDPRPVEERLKRALCAIYDEADDVTIDEIKEMADQQHDVTITRTGEEYEYDSTIVVTLTPVWEY